jgi:hypothetical protein
LNGTWQEKIDVLEEKPWLSLYPSGLFSFETKYEIIGLIEQWSSTLG